jgi:hypothetical protein
MLRHGSQERVHERHITHTSLVDNQEVAFERVLLVTREPPMLRVDLQEAVDGLGLKPGLLVHALGGASCRCGECHSDALGCHDAALDPRQCLIEIDLAPRRLSRCPLDQALGNSALIEMQALEKDAVLVTDGVGDDLAPGDLMVDRRPDQFSVYFEQPLGETGQLLDGQTAVAFIHGGLKREGNARAKPLWRGLLHSELRGDGVGGPKADPAYLSG